MVEHPAPWPGPSALLRAGAWLVGLAFALAMAIAAIGAGPWYDEFYTLAVTGGKAGFSKLFWHHWLADNHPPLFYMLVWATQCLGSEVEPRRLVNLGFCALAAWGLIQLGRRHRDARSLLCIYAMVLASAFPAIEKAAELRSNFLALAAASLAVAALVIRARPGANPEGRPDWPLALILALSFNVHFTATLIVGSLFSAFAMRLALARDWRGLRCLIVAGAIAALPLAMTTALQVATIDANTRSFWVSGGFTAARWSIQEVVTDALKANLPATVAGCAGLLLLAWRSTGANRDERQAADDAMALAAGAALALAVLLAVHTSRPIVTARYLIALYPAAAMVLALGATALVRNMHRSVGLAVSALVPLIALVAIANNLSQALARKSWYDTGRSIQAVLRACPQSAVHAAMVWNWPVMTMPPADNRAAMPLGYASVARRMGFALEPPQSRRMSAPCPTVFWTEHVANQRPAKAEIADTLRNEGFPVGEVRLLRYGRGWIVLASRAN